jgi:MFS superfamily sulfate permease-like transporter
LTLLNSVFAVSFLANRLFPGNGTRSTPRKIAVSVGLMNLVACPFGGMPVCHGSGGLAAQHAFGARTGWSMIILGAVKLATGLWFGALALAWMQAFPHTVLGVFLLLAGVALARASRFWHGRSIAVVAIVTAGVTFATRALPIGFAAGWVTHALICRKRTRNDDNVQA